MKRLATTLTTIALVPAMAFQNASASPTKAPAHKPQPSSRDDAHSATTRMPPTFIVGLGIEVLQRIVDLSLPLAAPISDSESMTFASAAVCSVKPDGIDVVAAGYKTSSHLQPSANMTDIRRFCATADSGPLSNEGTFRVFKVKGVPSPSGLKFIITGEITHSESVDSDAGQITASLPVVDLSELVLPLRIVDNLALIRLSGRLRLGDDKFEIGLWPVGTHKGVDPNTLSSVRSLGARVLLNLEAMNALFKTVVGRTGPIPLLPASKQHAAYVLTSLELDAKSAPDSDRTLAVVAVAQYLADGPFRHSAKAVIQFVHSGHVLKANSCAVDRVSDAVRRTPIVASIITAAYDALTRECARRSASAAFPGERSLFAVPIDTPSGRRALPFRVIGAVFDSSAMELDAILEEQ